MARKSDYLYHPAQSNSGSGGKDGRSNDCCKLSQLKFSLYLFNILFFISGFILASIGLWTFLEKHPSLILLTSGLYDVTACILIFAGNLIIILSLKLKFLVIQFNLNVSHWGKQESNDFLSITGIIILIIAIAGFCGAIRDNQSVILAYAILLSLIFLAEIGAGVLAYLYKEHVAEHLGNNLQVVLKEDYGIKNDSTAAVDHLQSR